MHLRGVHRRRVVHVPSGHRQRNHAVDDHPSTDAVALPFAHFAVRWGRQRRIQRAGCQQVAGLQKGKGRVTAEA